MEIKTFDHIHYFKPVEIEKTGAKLKDVQAETILKIDAWRAKLDVPVKLIWNGLTTGNHKSEQHPKGEAVDCYPTKSIPIYTAYKAALEVEFRGVGIYYNHETNIYSYHLDLGPDYRRWSAWKIRTSDPWTYGQLIKDPKEFIK